MKNKIYILIAAFCYLSTGLVTAQSSLYFYYDQACVQKMDYERTGIFHDIAYTDYYINISENKKAIFRVQKGNSYLNRELVSEIPEKPFMCADKELITDRLINSINKSTKIAYIVVAFGNQYAMYEVRTVSVLLENQDVISYNDEKYSFELNLNTVRNGDLLNAKSNKERNVFYDGNNKQNCFNQYKLKVVSKHPEDAIAYINLVSGLGVHKVFTKDGEIYLKTINEIPVNDAIQQKCNGGTWDISQKSTTTTTTTQTSVPSFNKDTIGMSDIDKALWESKQKVAGRSITRERTASTNELLPGGYYLVQSEESLYIISLKFDIPIRRIMEINKLDTYALTLGQRLKVVDDGTVPAQNRNPLIRTDNLAQTRTYIHIVEQGETLYSISLLYNLKLPELYRLNKQLQNDFISIDQQLVVGVQPL